MSANLEEMIKEAKEAKERSEKIVTEASEAPAENIHGTKRMATKAKEKTNGFLLNLTNKFSGRLATISLVGLVAVSSFNLGNGNIQNAISNIEKNQQDDSIGILTTIDHEIKDLAGIKIQTSTVQSNPNYSYYDAQDENIPKIIDVSLELPNFTIEEIDGGFKAKEIATQLFMDYENGKSIEEMKKYVDGLKPPHKQELEGAMKTIAKANLSPMEQLNLRNKLRNQNSP